MTGPLKISVATVAIRRYGSLADFQQHAATLAGQAADAGSGLLLLPELLCSGLLWSDPAAGAIPAAAVKTLYQRVLNPLYPAYCDVLSGLARRHRLVIAGASCWREREGRAVNTALWCRPDGTMAVQDKLHPTRPERAIDTVGGERVRLFELDGIRVGLIVCYDVQFPELSRALVDAGTELILVPSLTDRRGYWRVRHCALARAVENQAFVCVSPLVGELGIPQDRAVMRHGAALVACPIDNRFGIEDGVLAQGEMNIEQLIHARLDFDTLRLSRSRSEITQLADRRPELYSVKPGRE